jgi:hypothetical protein
VRKDCSTISRVGKRIKPKRLFSTERGIVN